MADQPKTDVAERNLDALTKPSLESFSVSNESEASKLVDRIEMIGEEDAAGLKPPPEQVTAGMRYLHCSRTIHQLVTDRNRAVGIYLATASLLMTASGAIYNAKPSGDVLVPFELIQRWCLPVTFAVLTVLSVLMAFLLIRTRIGMIYEVAKMNALLGLPIGRIARINPLSVFFILQLIISFAGGFTAAMFTIFVLYWNDPNTGYKALIAAPVGLAVAGLLIVLYIVTVKATTSDSRLNSVK